MFEPRWHLPWAKGHGAVALYPERDDEPPKTLDRMLLNAYGRVEPVLRHHADRLSLERGARMVEALAGEVARLDEAALAAEIADLRPRLLRSGLRAPLIARAFALIREVSERELGMRHFTVQLMGGWAMMRGQLAEMQTGEGKTLTALLPAVTAALSGAPVHVVTVNDYLADRDARHLAPVYAAFGLSVGIIQAGMEPPARRAAYACDVTYCTNKELVFDYLRDRATPAGRQGRVRRDLDRLLRPAAPRTEPTLRGLHFAIVDEADSVLIDEARTPLIISAERPDPELEPLCRTALGLARELDAGADYKVLTRERRVRLTPRGSARLTEEARDLGGWWGARRAREELVTQALSALRLYDRDRHYTIIDDKVQIVDEHTGRIMPDRSWERGLQQMIELKEGCPMTPRRETLARITYQRFFRRYLHLAGMTGTAREVAGELRAVFGLSVGRIPTNRPMRRLDRGVRLYRSAEAKWEAVVQAVRDVALRAGRPVLVGTTSVDASERLGRLLTARAIPHALLNARQDAREAEIIAEAGRPGRITIATNMAGRGTDIVLSDAIAKAGGLHVILTEFHESTRIDRQLFGRSGRQGQNGSHEAIVSIEDPVFRRFAPPWTLAAVGGRARREAPIPSLAAAALRRFVQRRCVRLNARIRLQMIHLDQRQERALAYAGRPE